MPAVMIASLFLRYKLLASALVIDDDIKPQIKRVENIDHFLNEGGILLCEAQVVVRTLLQSTLWEQRIFYGLDLPKLFIVKTFFGLQHLAFNFLHAFLHAGGFRSNQRA